MKKETAGPSEKSAKSAVAEKAAASTSMASHLPHLPEALNGPWRVPIGVAAAAGGGLLAAAIIGVGPAAIAGAAGYLAYRGMSGHKDEGGTKH